MVSQSSIVSRGFCSSEYCVKWTTDLEINAENIHSVGAFVGILEQHVCPCVLILTYVWGWGWGRNMQASQCKLDVENKVASCSENKTPSI